MDPKVQQALDELKQRLSDVSEPKLSDFVLAAYLQEKDLKVPKAEKRVREHLAWRKKHQVDERLPTYKAPEVLVKYPMHVFIGFDQNGAPVYLCRHDQVDILGYLKCCTTKELMDFSVLGSAEYIRKQIEEQCEKLGKNVGGVISITDMDDFTLPGAVLSNIKFMKWMKKNAKTLDRNYPGHFSVAYVINASKMFNTLWNIIKPVLSDKTTKRIKVYHKGDDSWREELLKTIDPTVLPQHWGGTKVGANGCPKCSEEFPFGGTIPPKYYMKKYQKEGDATAEDLDVSDVSEEEVEDEEDEKKE